MKAHYLLKEKQKDSSEGCREIDYRRLTVMQYQNSRTRFSRALTLVEMVIAMAIMAIVFAAILPQFRAIQNSWDSKQGSAETLQNGRVLIDHLNRNLSKAVRITSVSASSETNGYIEFEDNDVNNVRYDVNSTTKYVQFGTVGDLSELAGPVSQLQFTCYDAYDLDTPITDVNSVRFVKVETTLTNSAALGQDETFIGWAYLRANGNNPPEITKETPFEFDSVEGKTPALSKIDDTHYLCAYSGDGDDGWATVLTVDTGTWQITKETAFEFDTVEGTTPALSKIDDTHYLCAYSGDGDDGWATVLTVDTGTWEITQGAPFEFDDENGKTPALSKIDDTHYLCAYTGDSGDGWAVVLTLNGGSLVGWWKLDETSGLTAADSSDYGNHGTLTNMAGDEWTTGQVDGALEFDGNNDYVDCGDDDSLDITDEITMSAWINMASRPTNNHWSDVIWKVDAYSVYLTGQSDTETVLSGFFILDTGTIDTWKDANILLPLSSWVHVAVTFDGTDAKGYVNGELDFTKNKPGTIVTNTDPFTIGYTDDEYYEGSIDDVRLYNRALIYEEIKALAGGYNEWQTTKETPFEFDSSNGETPALSKIDDTHYLCAYGGGGDDGWATVLTVNTGTWAITNGTPFEFDIKMGLNPALSQMSSTNYLCTYQAFQDLGWSVILKVDTGSWTISKEDTYEFEENYTTISALAQIDQTHYLCAHTGPWSDGWAIVLASTPSLDTISKQGAGLEFDTDTGLAPALVEIDDSHYLCAYQGPGDDGWAVVLQTYRLRP